MSTLTLFTHKNYLKILELFKIAGYEIYTIKDFFLSDNKEGKKLILRHDVDRWAKQAIRMAKLEYDNNIRTTYYFRINNQGFFDEQTIRLIYNYNHEVGYHYETLSQCKGDKKEAIKLFEINLNKFRKIAPCYTVSMHGSPMSKYNNLELLKDINIIKYDLIADASLSFKSINVLYYTDTGRKLNSYNTLNFRDKIISKFNYSKNNLKFASKEFFQYLKDTNLPIYLNIHPERWAYSTFNLIICITKDIITNFIKMGIRLLKPHL